MKFLKENKVVTILILAGIIIGTLVTFFPDKVLPAIDLSAVYSTK